MPANLARPAPQKKTPVDEAKAKVLDLIRDGYGVREAMAVVDRKEETYKDWRKTDPQFRKAVDTIRSARADEKNTGRPPVPDFETFCRDWLKQPLFPHQLRMLDAIEGREPRDMHSSMSFEAGYDNRVLINVPPDHAKSTTFSANWVVWNIYKNPDVRVVIMSQGLDLAKKFLYEIKFKLTSPVFREMQMRFGPEGGWKDPQNEWTTDAIYVRGKNQNGVQKDPTVQAMGLKGTIYGQRADIIIMDDCITTKNAKELTFQMNVLEREIESRLPSDQEGGGLLLVLGTRVAPHELYRHLKDVRDADENRVWTYFRQPAVLDYGNGDSASWKTLWPERWNGPALARRRRASNWNLVYQQLDVDDEMTFKVDAVNASINGARFPGRGPFEFGPGSRPGGLSGLYMVGGLDPAAAGNTAIIIAGLDRESGKRFVLDGWNKPNATADQIIERFQWFTNEYRLNEWVIEQNALQRFIAQIPQVLQYAQARGCKVSPHFTNANKFDSDWGVQTMAPLFDSCVEYNEQLKRFMPTPPEDRLMELPSTRQNAWVNELIQQLTIWQPEGMAQKQKTDLVMALWFTHIAHTRQMNRGQNRLRFLTSPFTTPGRRRRQTTINLAELRGQQAELLQGSA